MISAYIEKGHSTFNIQIINSFISPGYHNEIWPALATILFIISIEKSIVLWIGHEFTEPVI